MKAFSRKFFLLHVIGLALLLGPATVPGQNGSGPTQKTQTSFAGKYEGTAKSPDGDVQFTLELFDEAGKFSGAATTPHGTFKVAKGQVTDGLLTLEFENGGGPIKLSLRQKDDKLVGELSAEGKTGSVELRRMSKDDISGEWDAAADAQGQPFPFTLSLKVEGEKVTGSSSSQLGTSTISSGNWKDGKLAIVLESGNGQIALVATLDSGKLVGDYDFAGQFSGKWAAVKKKP
jgi:hypothetical protein